MQVCEHLPREIGCASSTCNTQRDVLLLHCTQHACYFVVKAETGVVGVADSVAGIFGAWLRLFQWSVDVGVYPERPESIVQIEDYQLWERLAVCEGCGWEDFGGGEGDCCCRIRGGEGGSGLAARHGCCWEVVEEGEGGAVDSECNL